MSDKREFISQLNALEAEKGWAEGNARKCERKVCQYLSEMIDSYRRWKEANDEQNRLIAELQAHAVPAILPPPVQPEPPPMPEPEPVPEPVLLLESVPPPALPPVADTLPSPDVPPEDVKSWRTRALEIINAQPGIHFRELAATMNLPPYTCYGRLYRLRDKSITITGGLLRGIPSPETDKFKASLNRVIEDMS